MSPWTVHDVDVQTTVPRPEAPSPGAVSSSILAFVVIGSFAASPWPGASLHVLRVQRAIHPPAPSGTRRVSALATRANRRGGIGLVRGAGRPVLYRSRRRPDRVCGPRVWCPLGQS